MNVLTLAVLIHVLAKHGLLWESASVAWLLAMFADTVLLAMFIWNKSLTPTRRRGSR